MKVTKKMKKHEKVGAFCARLTYKSNHAISNKLYAKFMQQTERKERLP